jgi:hypothetical protein
VYGAWRELSAPRPPGAGYGAVPALKAHKGFTRFTRESTAPRAQRRPDDHAALKLVPIRIEIVLTEHAQELAAEECDVVPAVLDDAW